MSTDAATRFMEIWQENHDDHYTAHSMNVQDATIHQFLTEYALIPRADMPVLDGFGRAPSNLWDAADEMTKPEQLRYGASYNLARAEWFEAREAAEAETKLSERRNKVLREWWKRAGFHGLVPYEELRGEHPGLIAVDMILEAQDEAGK